MQVFEVFFFADDEKDVTFGQNVPRQGKLIPSVCYRVANRYDVQVVTLPQAEVAQGHPNELSRYWYLLYGARLRHDSTPSPLACRGAFLNGRKHV